MLAQAALAIDSADCFRNRTRAFVLVFCTWCPVTSLDLQKKASQLNNLTETARRGCKDVTLAISRVYLASITMARQYTINQKKSSEHASPLVLLAVEKTGSHINRNTQTAFPNIACSFIPHEQKLFLPSRTSSRRRSQWPPSQPRRRPSA
jgi:hypothetical protein